LQLSLKHYIGAEKRAAKAVQVLLLEVPRNDLSSRRVSIQEGGKGEEGTLGEREVSPRRPCFSRGGGGGEFEKKRNVSTPSTQLSP